MSRDIDSKAQADIRAMVYAFFAEECGRDCAELTDRTDIIRELDGDSLMLLSLLERVRKAYGLTIELKTLGRRLMKRPAGTIGQVVDLTLALVRHGDDIVNVDL